MPSINLGRVGFVLRGAWSSGTAYNQLDVVTYSGAAYAARTANTGVTPSSNSSVWQELTGISAAVQSAMNNAAVRFDTAQTLTSAQQTTARTNIDAASTTALGNLQTTVADMRQIVLVNQANVNNIYDYLFPTMDEVDALQEGMTTKAELNLKGASAISSGDDLNDYLTPGTYYITTTAIAASVKNLPPASQTPGKLFVMYINLTTRILQLFVPYTSNVGESFRTIVIRENDPNGNLVNSWHQYALTDSPAFTGNPTAPTQNAGDNSTKLATTAYSDASSDAAEQAAVNRCMTIGEGDAVTLQDNTNIDTLLTPAIYKVTTSDHAATMQGNPPTKEVAYRLVVMETTQTNRLWQIALGNANLNPRIRKYNGTTWSEWNVLAYINSPAFTGNPTAPTQNAGDNSTKLATTAYADRAAKSAALGELTKNGIYSATDDEHVIKNYAIDSGVWVHGTSQNCSIIPVTPGDYVVVQANTAGNSSIAVLTQYPEPVSGSTPPFSGQTGFTGTITITKGTEQAFTMPSDAAYLYIYLRVLENGAYQRLPAHLLINGYDYAHTIADNISDKAPIDSPAFTGTPTAPTQEAGNNSMAIATTAYVDRAAASAPVKIRVMQNNLGKMNNGESLAGNYHLLNTDNYQTIFENYKSLYSKYQPDIIGYEEFVAEIDIYTAGASPVVDHTENLITALYERLYPNIKYPTSTSVTSKLGILSKYPIIDYSRTRIDFTFQWEGQTESSYAFVIYGHVNVGGKPLAYCVNTMTQDDNRQKGVAKRAALLPLILNMFANDDYAMMIADVNNGGTGQSKTSLEYSIAEANDLYNNIIKPAGFETVMGSYFGYSQTWESYDYHYIGSIDNIYYKNNGKIVFSGLQVLNEEAAGLASDHVPIIADFTLI